MRKIKSFLNIVVIFSLAAALNCGGTTTEDSGNDTGNGTDTGGTEEQFDDQTLNDNEAQIETNVTNAELIFSGTIQSIGDAPPFWSGVSSVYQAVTYTVDGVLKGTYSDSTITIYHLIVENSRHADTAPGLSSSIFAVGQKLIVFAKQNENYAILGSDIELPLYVDFDEDYGTIPYSTQNEDVIETTIASLQVTAPVESSTLASLAIVGFGKGLTVNGDAADVQTFNDRLDACRSLSPALATLMGEIEASATTLTINVVRNAERNFVDSFRTRSVDIADLEAWHDGCNDRTDVCQLFIHILKEYWHAETTGDGYAPSHAEAIDAENDVRHDLSKTTTLTGHTSVQRGGDTYMVSPYDGSTELVKIVIDANGHASPGDVTVEYNASSAPTNLAVVDTVSCQLTLSWTDNTSDESYFSIERRDETDGGDWEAEVPSHESSANATSWTNSYADDNTLQPGHRYCYRVRAWKTSGPDLDIVSTAYSSEACGTKQ